MKQVFISGMGAITPYGVGGELLREGLLAGRSAVRRIASFDVSRLPVQIGGEVPPIDLSEHFEPREEPLLSRLSAYAVIASRMALADAGIGTMEDTRHAAVFLGTGFGTLPESATHYLDYAERGVKAARPTTIPLLMLNAPAAQMAMKLGLQGPNLTLATACGSGSNAIGQAFKEIQAGRVDMALAGGGELALIEPIFHCWCRMRVLSRRNGSPEQACRPFDRQRDGMVASDALVMLVLESGEALARRGGRARAEVVGYATNCDATHVTAPNLETEVMAMRGALRDADLTPRAVDYICAHGTSTRLNDQTEAEAIRQVFGEEADRVRVSAVKSMVGHTMGASGAIGAAAAIFALEEGRIPPTINLEQPDPECRLNHVANQAAEQPLGVALVNSFGFGGHNAVLILRRAGGTGIKGGADG